MSIKNCIALLLLGFGVSGCMSQKPDTIAESHIQSNVPQPGVFDIYMRRDLGTYLCAGIKDCRVDYVLLRDGATQTGIAYPKYYLWAKCFHGTTLINQGAVRVAAINKEAFQITDFLSKEQIMESPAQVANVFPSPLVEKILTYAHN